MTENNNEQLASERFANSVIRLLRGVVYEEQAKAWLELLKYQTAVKRHFAQIGITVIIDEQEGFAFLEQPAREDNENDAPRLMAKNTLSYEQSVLCVLLREQLEVSDGSATITGGLFFTQQEIKELVEGFYKERRHLSNLVKEIQKHIRRLEELNFLKCVNRETAENDTEKRYKVQRILKAFIKLDDLQNLKNSCREVTGPVASKLPLTVASSHSLTRRTPPPELLPTSISDW